jgi:predicted phage-related endonuclease
MQITAAEKYMPQLQHNMWVVAARSAVLSVITGGGKWVEILTHADPLYQHLIVTAERKFWRCVESGEQPQLCGVKPPKPRLAAVRIIDMTSSDAWAEFAAIFTHMRRSQAALRSCARRWGSMRSRQCRPPRSTRLPAL